MCDPVSVAIGAGLAVEIGSKVVQHNAARDQAKNIRGATAEAADRNEHQQISRLTTRETQEQDAAGQSILAADRQARMADAEARVQAGEAGVAGASVDALLEDIQNRTSAFKVATNQNLTNNIDQLEAEKTGVRINTKNQKTMAAVNNPNPSGLALGLGIAGSVLDYGGLLIRRSPKPTGG